MATKYETLESLKGATTIDVFDYLDTRHEELRKIKSSWGKTQTATDEKFFKEKELELRQFKTQLETMILQMGITEPYPIGNCDIKLIVSKKK
jgi:hypothetical protein